MVLKRKLNPKTRDLTGLMQFDPQSFCCIFFCIDPPVDHFFLTKPISLSECNRIALNE